MLATTTTPMFKVFPQHFTPDLCYNIDEVGKPRIYVTTHGQRYPSITSILSATMSESKRNILDDWIKRVGEEEAEQIKQDAADRGSAMHDMLEKFVFGQDYAEEYKNATFKVKRLFDQVRKVLTKHVTDIRMLEKPLYSDLLKIAGRVDCIGMFNGKLSIIDFKTSTRRKTLDDIDDYLIQETFYAVAYAEHFGEKIEQIVTIIATEKAMSATVIIDTPKQYLPELKNRVKQYYSMQSI